MPTEIIKLSSLRNNLEAVFNGLINKFRGSSNYEITMVIQEQERTSLQVEEEDSITPHKHNVVFNENTLILNQDLDE